MNRPLQDRALVANLQLAQPIQAATGNLEFNYLVSVDFVAELQSFCKGAVTFEGDPLSFNCPLIFVRSWPGDLEVAQPTTDNVNKNPLQVILISSSFTTTSTMVSDWAVWSGYQLEPDAYKRFVGVFRGTGDVQDPNKTIPDYIFKYVQWRESLPPKLAARAPNIRFRTSDREGKNITHIFFPIRFIPFKSRRQLNDPTHPDYVIAHEETEKDKRKLQSLLNYIHAHNGGEHRMDADLFEFAVMKDLHPLAEWRAY